MLEKPPFHPEKSVSCLGCPPENCHDDNCVIYVLGDGSFYPPPPPIIHVTNEKYHMPYYFILMLCVLGAVFLFICYIIILKRNRSNSRIRRSVSELDENRDDLVIDENHGPILDHPIWYIRTIGLTQDVIDSISVFKYKKDEILIEGSDCSVCLTEFEEDESLRLLPKCSHAFHVPCIDTWLRSHKNCPLCRAPIVSSDMDNVPQMDHVVEVVSITGVDDESSSNEVDQGLENVELDAEGNQETRRGVLENVDDDEEGRSMMDLSMKIPCVLDGRRKGVRVFSDLADQHRMEVMNDIKLQPARRSVSMDSSAAQVIHLAMNEMINLRKIDQGCSSSKRGDRNSSLYKAMKSSSFGRSLQKVPMSMKRSFSTSGKCSLSTTSKIQDPRQTM